MKEVIKRVLIKELGLIFILLVLIASLIQIFRSVKFQKKFDKFSLTSEKNINDSIFDKLEKRFWLFIRNISKILRKSKILNKCSKSYDRYILYTEKDEKDSLNYISLKLFLCVFFLSLNVITALFKVHKFSIISLVITGGISFYLPDIVLKLKFKRKKKSVQNDLIKALIIINSSLKNGRNILKAISDVTRKLDGGVEDELQKIYEDMTYGISPEEAFLRFAKRIRVKNAYIIAESLLVLSKSTGSMKDIFEVIQHIIEDRQKAYNELKYNKKVVRFLLRVILPIPIAILLVIYLINPSYFNILFSSVLGHIFIAIFIVIFIMIALLFKKVLKVKI